METDNRLDLRRLWRAMKQCKWIYLISALFFTSAAIFYVSRTLPQYPIQGSLLINDNTDNSTVGTSGTMAQMMKTFSVGGFSASAVDNEVLILSSHDVMLRTVKMLGLNRSYIGKTDEGKKALLYRNSPIAVEAPAEYFDTLKESYQVKIKLLPDGKADIKVQQGLLRHTLAEYENATLPTTINTTLGNLQILRTDHYESSPYRNITIGVCGNDIAATILGQNMDIDVATKLSDVIQIDFKYSNPELGKAIVNGVMTEYNAKRLNRLQETSVASIKYYDDRIAETAKQLESAEQKVADYERANSLSGAEAEAPILIESAYENRAAILKAQNEISYYETVLNTLRSNPDNDVLIPQIKNFGDSTTVTTFNNAVLNRRDLRRSAKEDNTALVLLNEKIETLRNIIIENSEKTLDRAQVDLATLRQLANRSDSRLNQYPSFQKEYFGLIRDKKFQNQLYIYLLQNRENAVLQYYSTNNAGLFMYQPAFVLKSSDMIRKLIIVFGAFIFSLFAASCVALLQLLRSRKVTESIDLAFIGIEANTVLYTGGRDQINKMRTNLTANDRHIIYTADFSDNDNTINALTESLQAAGRTVEIIGSATDNDNLLSDEFQSKIKARLSGTDFIIIRIPNTDRLFELQTSVDDDKACLLTILPSNGLTRKGIKDLLKGQNIDRIYAIIVK